MTAALAVTVLAAPGPWVDAFWQRDFGALQRALARGDDGPDRALFEDLSRLVSCLPLEAAPETEAARALVRLEAARRQRLGPEVEAAKTLWRDILNPSFFERPTLTKAVTPLLLWPAESEAWPGEEPVIDPQPWRCDQPAEAGDELAIATEALVERLPAPDSSRVSYLRAGLLWNAGRRDEAALSARRIDPAHLEPALRFHARLLRLYTAVDPAGGFTELAQPGASDPVILERAGYELARREQWEGVLALAAASPYLRSLRAQAWFHRGEPDRALDELASAQVLAPDDRPLVISILASRAMDEAWLHRLGAADDGAVLLARAALAAGNTALAAGLADRLAASSSGRAHAAGLVLRAELAFLSAPAAFQTSTAALMAEDAEQFRGRRGRADRDRAALQLAQGLVSLLAQRPDSSWQARLSGFLRQLREAISSAHLRELDRLIAALEHPAPFGDRGKPMVIGDIAVSAPLALRAPPPLPERLAWAEPYSLLAIPTEAGGSRAWFGDPEEGADAR